MRIFGRKIGPEPETQAARVRREASQRNLEQGGLPLNALERLQEQTARQGTPQQFFTSDLSVNEFVLTRRVGFEPLGQVMGSSVYHVGWQPNIGQTAGWRWSALNQELNVLTAAYREARERALGRLHQEAALLGASGVVGVRLQRTSFDGKSSMVEFSALGTAVREIGATAAPSLPFLSGLSGSEHYALVNAGYRPVGYTLGNCAYYCVPGIRTRNATTGGILGSGWNNQELKDFTQAVYAARSLTMERLEEEARRVQASGVVGVTTEFHIEMVEVGEGEGKREDLLCLFTAAGTAIIESGSPAKSATELQLPMR